MLFKNIGENIFALLYLVSIVLRVNDGLILSPGQPGSLESGLTGDNKLYLQQYAGKQFDPNIDLNSKHVMNYT